MKVHFPLFGCREAAVIDKPIPAHHIESDFRAAICRFVLECSCGAQHTTPYIDEALEWRELHARLAPIADQLSSRSSV